MQECREKRKSFSSVPQIHRERACGNEEAVPLTL